MRFIFKIILLFIFISCQTPKRIISQSRQDLFSGYTFLDLPLSNLRIGATYIDGISANGEGLSKEDLFIQKSYSLSRINSDQSTTAKVNASLFNLLGLDAQYTKSDQVTLVYSGIEVVSVKDLFSLNIRTGTKYITQGLRVSNLSILADRRLTSQIKANLKQNNEDILIDIQPKKAKDQITLNGSDIFIAYKLLTFDKPILEKSNIQIEPTSPNEFGAVLNNYKFKFEFDSLLSCVKNYYPIDKTNLTDTQSLEEIYPNDPVFIGENGKGIQLLPIECRNSIYNVNIQNYEAISSSNTPTIKFQIPFLLKLQNRQDYVLDSFLEGTYFIIEKLEFRDIALQHLEETHKRDKKRVFSYYVLQGEIILSRYKYKMNTVFAKK